jgi:hypothetical protein
MIEKIFIRSTRSLEHPMAKWALSEMEKGNDIILEIMPSYYST